MRVLQHIVDTQTVKQTLNAFPHEWVIRELSERDYGIDLMIEIFAENGLDKNKNKKYESTGYTCWLQLKGTSHKLAIKKDQTITYKLSRKALCYVEKFPIPFFLLRSSTTSKGDIYFVWLQRYISDVLDIKDPSWRTSGKPGDKLKIYIPDHNNLAHRLDKVVKICSRIKYIEEQAEFHERFQNILTWLNPNMMQDDSVYDLVISNLKRIKRLKTLIEHNNSCISDSSIQSLIDSVVDIKTGAEELSHFKKNHNMDNIMLLFADHKNRRFIEEFSAENDDDTVY